MSSGTETLHNSTRCRAPRAASSQPSETKRLLLISFAALYLELVLIRWIGTEVKIFAFFQNLSLIVCFLGFGLGCFGCKQRGSLLPSLAATTTMVVTVYLPIDSWQLFLKSLSSLLSHAPDAALWGRQLQNISTALYYQGVALSLAVVALFLILLVIAMVPLGRWVGYYLEAASNTVTGYSINLLGSLAGIWLLAVLAFFWLSPGYWFAIAFLLIMLAQPFSWRSFLVAGALLAITLLALHLSKPTTSLLGTPKSADGNFVYWSPYQKLSVEHYGNPADRQYQIEVNNEGYMSIANVSPEFVAQHPQVASSIQDSSYDSPFRFTRGANNVLVVGAGAGNDVAAALRHGASRVDAVEIDPLILSLGERLHPEHPYTSPNVHLINNDARNFLRRCRNQYDVIIFGLLDSHTEFSGYSNMRVDNYVYTEESFRDARRLLAPDGILVLKFEVRQPWTWIGQRFYVMLGGIFFHPPLTYYAPEAAGSMYSATVFVESDSPNFWRNATATRLSAYVSSRPPDFPLTVEHAPPPTTDDWPYVYHYGHAVPRAYLLVSAVILALTLYMVGPYFKPRESSTWQFFLLGAGFLLMETKLVSSLALYFGTTWIVNSIALTGILSVLLLANLYVTFRRPENLSVYYAALIAALLANFVVHWNRVPGSGTSVGILVCLAHCVPIFFAGIVFTESFRRRGGRSDAFGANMLGAVAGGLAQNLSFIVGMKALLLIAALLYVAAALLEQVRPSPGLASEA